MSNNLKFYSIFSGIFFEIPEAHVKHMDCGDIPLLDFPSKTCKHCYGRGYIGVDTKLGHYTPCKCTCKMIDKDRIVHKEIFDIPLNLKYQQEIPNEAVQ